MTPQVLKGTDAPQIAEIAKASFPVVWSEKDFAYFLDHECAFCFGYFEPGSDGKPRLISYLISLLVRGEVDVISIATRPEARRRGLAESLLGFAKEHPQVDRVVLEVDVTNEAAIQLYKKMGFEQYGIRKKYYEQSRDAYYMGFERDKSTVDAGHPRESFSL